MWVVQKCIYRCSTLYCEKKRTPHGMSMSVASLVTLLQQWHCIPLVPLIPLVRLLFTLLPFWCFCSWCIKNTFRILVYSKEYTFSVLLFCFQRPDIGRRLANMPLDSFVAVRGWVYPRPPGQRNVVNIICSYFCVSCSQISRVCSVYSLY